MTTLAGSEPGYADATGSAAKFNYLQGICFDDISQSLIVCDKDNNKLRRVQLNGMQLKLMLSSLSRSHHDLYSHANDEMQAMCPRSAKSLNLWE